MSYNCLLSTLLFLSKRNIGETILRCPHIHVHILPDSFGALDLSVYPFMFPTSVAVSTCAISAGIGGAALFAPIFLIIFPIMGPQYPLESSTAAVASAILVESFGFTSGLVGYFRRGLIDYTLAVPFLLISIPAAIVSAKYLSFDPIILKCIYTILMLSISVSLFTKPSSINVEERSTSASINFNAVHDQMIQKVDKSGIEYLYPKLNINPQLQFLSLCGGLLTGCLGVGIGELTLPQLLNNTVPVPIAAATSTLVVALTAWSSAFVQVQELIASPAGLSAIPWKLIIYMLPGVIIGGQIASALQGRLSQEVLEKAISILFGAIGIAFACLVIRETLL